MINKKILSMPLLFVFLWIVGTLFLSFSNIIIYENYNKTYVFIYSFFVIISIIIGYKSFHFVKYKIAVDYEKKANYLDIVKISIIITILVYFTAIVWNSFSKGVSLNTFLDRIIHTSDVYKSTELDTLNMKFVNYLIAFTGVFKLITYCGMIVYWKKLKKYKILAIFAALLVLVNNMVFLGSMKEIGDFFVFLISAFICKKINIDKESIKKVAIITAVTCIVVFGFILFTRTVGYEYGEFTEKNEPGYFSFNSKNIFYRVFGNTIGYSITYLVFYCSHGWYGLGNSLQAPWTFTWFVGNSFSLSAYFQKIFGGESMMYKTYPFLAQNITGYDPLLYWSTMFPWLASDYTWIGAILIIALISRLYASVWEKCNTKDNILYVCLFGQLNVLWLYLPANNQIMQTLQSVVTTIFLILYFIIKNLKKQVIYEFI